ncbi:hypothetical protein VPNG_06904 [Cytospora leucostoma]|uniref:DUF676 domain-containing protein n=1 Tax=Cytospora leucostoma TaxID=1230097 RepID=A0A423WXE8_9PEZI|nr:hypothetical protein VPNG_06904 [Cytospora leucostoma]
MGPTFITAAVYMVLPHILAVYGSDLSIIAEPVWLSYFSLGWDIFTLAFQAIGSAFAAEGSSKTEIQQGINVLIAGLGLQIFSILGFFGLYYWHMSRAHRNRDFLDPRFSAVYNSAKFKSALLCMQVALGLILARTIARLIQLKSGLGSSLSQSQVYVVVLDGTLVLLAAILLTIFTPGSAFGRAWGMTSPYKKKARFAELKLAGSYLPPLHYWRGIKEALTAHGTEVITATVPPSGSIEERSARLRQNILEGSQGRPVNIIAHSMGGLDARYMISYAHRRRLQKQQKGNDINVKALVTIATPHHGSAYADFLFDKIGPERLTHVYDIWRRMTGLGTGAFEQLTRRYMAEEFNPKIIDDPGVQYFSYGAALTRKPPLLSPFRGSYGVLLRTEGPNDGLVSVESAKWGTYKGTLESVSHLDLINWTNKLRWTLRKWMGEQNPFNAVAFYLEIVDMLEKEDL